MRPARSSQRLPSGGECHPTPGWATLYRYRDEGGHVLHGTFRYANPKRFLQGRPAPGCVEPADIPTDWLLGLDGMQTILYRLPELLAADPAQLVYIVEGEKDADRLAQSGWIATSSPMGAKYPWQPHFSEWLQNRHVAIVPDGDECGEQHVQKLKSALLPVAASVRIVRLKHG